MTQRIEMKRGRSIKKLLAELANRQLTWREQKTKEIITSQKTGLNITSSLRIDFLKNHNELQTVKSASNSVKNIRIKPQNRVKRQLNSNNELNHNGSPNVTKRSMTEKDYKKTIRFNLNNTIQDENQPPRHEKQSFLPKLNDLKKKTSLQFMKSEAAERQKGQDEEYLSIIEQQEQSVLKKDFQTKSYKIHHKDLF